MGLSERCVNTLTVPLSVFDISDVPRSELYDKEISKRQNPIINPIMIPQKITEKKFPTHKNKSTRLIFPIFHQFLFITSNWPTNQKLVKLNLSVSVIWHSKRRKFTIMMQASNALEWSEHGIVYDHPWKFYTPHKPNIHDLNSDTHTLFLSILIRNSQCVGVANAVIDIWYIGVMMFFMIIESLKKISPDSARLGSARQLKMNKIRNG